MEMGALPHPLPYLQQGPAAIRDIPVGLQGTWTYWPRSQKSTGDHTLVKDDMSVKEMARLVLEGSIRGQVNVGSMLAMPGWTLNEGSALPNGNDFYAFLNGLAANSR